MAKAVKSRYESIMQSINDGVEEALENKDKLLQNDEDLKKSTSLEEKLENVKVINEDNNKMDSTDLEKNKKPRKTSTPFNLLKKNPKKDVSENQQEKEVGNIDEDNDVFLNNVIDISLVQKKNKKIEIIENNKKIPNSNETEIDNSDSLNNDLKSFKKPKIFNKIKRDKKSENLKSPEIQVEPSCIEDDLCEEPINSKNETKVKNHVYNTVDVIGKGGKIAINKISTTAVTVGKGGKSVLKKIVPGGGEKEDEPKISVETTES